MKIEATVLRDLDRASRLEWLLADGLGGWASSTVLGLNSRRYHGLLVCATRPPVGRQVVLSRIEESWLSVEGERFELSTNAYEGAIHPRGFEHLEWFALDPLPSWCFGLPQGRLIRTVCRVQGANAVVVQYRWESAVRAELRLRPLLACRDLHSLQRENDQVRPGSRELAGDVVIEPYESSWPVFFRLAGGTWSPEGFWYRSFRYELERERGLDFHEDLWSPGEFRKALKPGETIRFVASAGTRPPAGDLEALLADERRRMRELAAGRLGLEADLRRAADTFLVRRGEQGRSVVAGYHWFADWGRDTMIALPGLCLSTGRLSEARAILGELARHIDGGLIPNRFPDRGEAPEYNSVDAALWMVLAVQRLSQADPDFGRVRGRLSAAVDSILDAYARGTRHGIRLRPDGLIEAGEEGVQLTWMDARVGEHVVTPRHGCPIEIQALWHNALLCGAELARGLGNSARSVELTVLASRCRDSVLKLFWSEPRGYLADVVSSQGVADLSLRPNQVYAIGLPHGLLPRDKAERSLSAVEASLLTPRGLRTLAPWDPAYRGRYRGGVEERDAAYHQGTVWPFLMGVFVDALIKIRGELGKQQARGWLSQFSSHLQEAGLGSVSEIFDGEPPHAPAGAISQAWSVAELLRLSARLGRAPRASSNGR